MRLYFEGYVDIEPDHWYDADSKDERDWFFEHILVNDLIIHSNEIGDALGDFVVCRVFPVGEEK